VALERDVDQTLALGTPAEIAADPIPGDRVERAVIDRVHGRKTSRRA
jgi:hypothetical protein